MKNSCKQNGLAQVPLLIGLVLMAVALPLVSKLVQTNLDNRSSAACKYQGSEMVCTVDPNTSVKQAVRVAASTNNAQVIVKEENKPVVVAVKESTKVAENTSNAVNVNGGSLKVTSPTGAVSQEVQKAVEEAKSAVKQVGASGYINPLAGEILPSPSFSRGMPCEPVSNNPNGNYKCEGYISTSCQAEVPDDGISAVSWKYDTIENCTYGCDKLTGRCKQQPPTSTPIPDSRQKCKDTDQNNLGGDFPVCETTCTNGWTVEGAYSYCNEASKNTGSCNVSNAGTVKYEGSGMRKCVCSGTSGSYSCHWEDIVTDGIVYNPTPTKSSGKSSGGDPCADLTSESNAKSCCGSSYHFDQISGKYGCGSEVNIGGTNPTTPIPTSVPSSVTLMAKVTFGGVNDTAKCALDWPVKVVVLGGGQTSVFTGVKAVRTGEVVDGREVFQITVNVGNMTTKTGLALFVKGPKHLQMKYAVDGQDKEYTQAGGQLCTGTGCPVVYNFTKLPMMAGDVNQDGTVDGQDFSLVKNDSITRKSVAEGEYMSSDLNGNCQMESQDLSLLMVSLSYKQSQLY